MSLHFTKMHGCGNDYIYINAIEQPINDPSALSIQLSDRHFSIGGDGVILICPSDVADAKMRMFNADGSEGKMCGNGVRCVGKYVHDYLDAKDEISIETLSGIKYLQVSTKNGKAEKLRVDMGKAILDPEQIPTMIQSKNNDNKIVNQEASFGGKIYQVTCVSMGNPHMVIFGDDPDLLDLPSIGFQFELSPLFPDSVNTEFVQVISPTELKMRVWERGSGETLACGTGACAVAVAAVLNGYCQYDTDIVVRLRGGNLIINYKIDGTVFMTGEATEVFQGNIEVE